MIDLNDLAANPEKIWELGMEEVMEIPLDWINEDYEPVTAEEREQLFALLGKPRGVGLPNGFITPDAEAAALNVILRPGDHVVENYVAIRGLHILKIARLGSRPDVDYYVGQVSGPVQVLYDLVEDLKTGVVVLAMVWKTGR